MSETTDSKKDTVKGIIGECIMYIPIFLLSVLFIMLVLTMFSDSAAKLIGYLFCIGIGDDSKIETIQLLIRMISRMFVFIGLVFLIQRADSMKEAIEKMVGKWIVPISAALFIVLLVVLISFIFFDYTEKWVRNLLDVKDDQNKIAIVELLGWMMSGMLAVVGIVVLNRRAEAQVEDNRLVEKGHMQERLKTATKYLGHGKPSVRIAAFYEFLHLMKEDSEKYRKSTLDILYAHIRATTDDFANSKDVKDAEGRGELIKPTEEIQGLLDILFKSRDIDRSDTKPNLQRIYFSGVDLTHGNLSGANLSGANLSGANLSGADLSGATLSGATLSGTKLSGAKLPGAKLPGAKLPRANLSEADLSGADLSGADLPEANLSRANLSRVNLSRAFLPRANLSRAFLPGVSLSRANLSGANLSGANLSGADLSRANLSRADLSRVNLSRVNLSGALLSGADLSRANLSRADLSRADLSKADLSKADLSKADLSNADLSKVHLRGTSYTNKTRFPEWLQAPLPLDNGDKAYFPLDFVAPEKPESGE